MFKFYEIHKRFSIFRKAVYLAEIFHLFSLWSVIQTVLSSNYYSVDLNEIFFKGISKYVSFSGSVLALLAASFVFLLLSISKYQNRFFYAGTFISLTLFYEIIGPVLDGGSNLSVCNPHFK